MSEFTCGFFVLVHVLYTSLIPSFILVLKLPLICLARRSPSSCLLCSLTCLYHLSTSSLSGPTRWSLFVLLRSHPGISPFSRAQAFEVWRMEFRMQDQGTRRSLLLRCPCFQMLLAGSIRKHICVYTHICLYFRDYSSICSRSVSSCW